MDHTRLEENVLIILNMNNFIDYCNLYYFIIPKCRFWNPINYSLLYYTNVEDVIIKGNSYTITLSGLDFLLTYFRRKVRDREDLELCTHFLFESANQLTTVFVLHCNTILSLKYSSEIGGIKNYSLVHLTTHQGHTVHVHVASLHLRGC